MKVLQPPTITFPSGIAFAVGHAGKYTVTTSGALPTPVALSISGTLPKGVTFVNSTGVFSGTPLPGTGGSYSVSITASNSALSKTTQAVILTVTDVPAFKTTATTFHVGQAGSFTIRTSGFPFPTITSNTLLPDGLTLVDNGDGTALLSGTPTGAGGVYPISLTAANATSVTQTFQLTILQAPIITSSATAMFTAGTAGRFTITTTGFPTAAITESVTLPAGLTFHDNGDGTATIRGTPTRRTTIAITITASSGTSKAIQTLSLIVS